LQIDILYLCTIFGKEQLIRREAEGRFLGENAEELRGLLVADFFRCVSN